MAARKRTKVFAFINSGSGTDWVLGVALDEHGDCVAAHVSSSDAFARHDMGATAACAMHYQDYVERYGYDAFEVEWVADPRNHAGLAAAYARNQAKWATAERLPPGEGRDMDVHLPTRRTGGGGS